MATLHSITPGKIIEISGTDLVVRTRVGELITVPVRYSEAETLNVVVHTVNGVPMCVQDACVWANIMAPEAA